MAAPRFRGGWLLAALTLAACAPLAPPPGSVPTPTPVPGAIAPAGPEYAIQRGDIVLTLDFDGEVTPAEQTAHYFETGGVVQDVFAAPGDRVAPGDRLAVLAGVEALEQEQALQQIQVDRAAVQLDIAEARLALFDQTADPDAQGYALERSILENEITLAQLALAETTLQLEALAGRTAGLTVTASAAGEVLSSDLAPGVEVEAFEPVLVVGDPASLEITAEVPPADRVGVEVGTPVVILRGDGAEAAGTIAALPGSAGGAGDDLVHIAIDPAALADFELGERVEIILEVDRREGVLWLPPQAVRTFSGRRFVVVQDGTSQRSVDVQLGLWSEDRVEISAVEGQAPLEEGQIVIGP